MGNMHLVTGYQGKEHVTAADHGSLYAAIFGGGSYVLDRGNKLAASMITSNQVRIADGDMVIQGRHARLNEGATVDLTIESGAQGQKRNDLVVARYTRNASSGVEEVNLVVIKGTPATSDPTDPAYANGDILTDHAETVDFPLYRIPLDGITVGTPVQLFDVAYLVTLGSDKKVPAEYLPSMDYIPNSKRGAANGVAPLNSSKKIESTYLPSMNYISTSQRGAANGVASLDANKRIPDEQLGGTAVKGGTVKAYSGADYTVNNYEVSYRYVGKLVCVTGFADITSPKDETGILMKIGGIPSWNDTVYGTSGLYFKAFVTPTTSTSCNDVLNWRFESCIGEYSAYVALKSGTYRYRFSFTYFED